VDRVVVADDNQFLTKVLGMVLKRWGWDPVIAHDGIAAVAAIHDARPAVALVDINLPKLNGLEVARSIRAGPALLVALSGYGDSRRRRESLEAGFDQHLVKPVDPDVLHTLLLGARRRGGDSAAAVPRADR
jgi:DNA-binding response OmpR family regulator